MSSDQNPYQAPGVHIEAEGGPVLPAGELASRGTRFAGALIDGLIQLAIIMPLQFALGVYDGFPQVKQMNALETLVWGVGGFALYFALNGYLLAKSGQTIGKRLVGTRIVNVTDGQQTPFSKIVTARVLPMQVAALIPVVGGVLALVDALFIFRKDYRCVHDLIAGTVVVKV